MDNTSLHFEFIGKFSKHVIITEDVTWGLGLKGVPRGKSPAVEHDLELQDAGVHDLSIKLLHIKTYDFGS